MSKLSNEFDSVKFMQLIDPRKFKDSNGLVRVGDFDVTDGFQVVIDQIKGFLEDNVITTFNISSVKSRFRSMTFNGESDEVSENFNRIIATNNLEINRVVMSIDAAEEKDKFRFALFADVDIDGINESLSLNAYDWEQEFSHFHLLTGFYNEIELDFEVSDDIAE